MEMANRVGRPKGLPRTGGRKKGVPNKATRDIQELAREYTPDAIKALAAVVKQEENLTARIAAAKELLDRGYGKAKQDVAVTGDMQINIITEIGRNPDD